MSFTSPRFIALIAAGLPLYYLLYGKHQWVILLALSAAFYMEAGPGSGFFLLFTICLNYSAGLLLSAAEDKGRKSLITALCCAVNFVLLFSLKYGGLGLILPLGISFYTFQSVGYVIDCSRGKEPERNILRFALFVSFFPQMVQGPISRFAQLQPQLCASRRADARSIKLGIQLMMWGYFKKLVIADRAAIAANHIFAAHLSYQGAVTVFGVLIYCIQLYCDFSGGIDITRGAAQMYGIDLAENFARPLFALSLADYWRRWHMSLGSWMKDYVFYPLTFSKPFVQLGAKARRRIGGRAGKMAATTLSTLIVYFMIGMWHGLELKYLLFGLYNGLIISSTQLLEPQYLKLRERLGICPENGLWKAFCTLRTAFLVFIGRYISRAENIPAALSMLKRSLLHFELSELSRCLPDFGLKNADYIVIFAGVLVLLAAEAYQEKHGSIREWTEKQPAFIQWILMIVPMLVLLFFGIIRDSYIASEFIYKQY